MSPLQVPTGHVRLYGQALCESESKEVFPDRTVSRWQALAPSSRTRFRATQEMRHFEMLAVISTYMKTCPRVPSALLAFQKKRIGTRFSHNIWPHKYCRSLEKTQI